MLSFHGILDAKQGDDIVIPASERPKRRHARPQELDSDGDDDENDDKGKEDDRTLDEEITPDKVETLVPDSYAPQMPVNRVLCVLCISYSN